MTNKTLIIAEVGSVHDGSLGNALLTLWASPFSLNLGIQPCTGG